MTGWVRLHRGWRDCEFFSAYHQKTFSEREAWLWLIENAAWKDTTRSAATGQPVSVKRGQLHSSLRSLQTAWGWDKSRVERFLKRLVEWSMIEMAAGKDGRTLTLCNYELYQHQREGNETPPEKETGRLRDTQEEEKKDKKKEGKKEEEVLAARGGKDYRFAGETIRLMAKDYDKWAEAYSSIPDLSAELTALDAWWRTQPAEKRKNWFHATSGMLNRKHQELVTKKGVTNGMTEDEAAKRIEHLRFVLNHWKGYEVSYQIENKDKRLAYMDELATLEKAFPQKKGWRN